MGYADGYRLETNSKRLSRRYLPRGAGLVYTTESPAAVARARRSIRIAAIAHPALFLFLAAHFAASSYVIVAVPGLGAKALAGLILISIFTGAGAGAFLAFSVRAIRCWIDARRHDRAQARAAEGLLPSE